MQRSNVYMSIAGAVFMLCVGGCQVTDMFNSFLGGKKQSSCISSSDAPLDPKQARDLNPDDPVVLKIDGSPACTKSEFLEFSAQAMAANPYLAQFGITSYQTAPDPIKEQLFEAMVQSKLVVRHSTAEGVAKSAEFTQALEKAITQIKQALLLQMFDKKVLDEIIVTDEEVAEKYDEMRDRFVKEYASCTAVGAKFESEEKAKVFYHLVSKTEEGTFEELAEEAGAEVVDFGKVSHDPRMAMQSEVPIPVRQAVAAATSETQFVQARDGDDDWVIKVSDVTSAVHASLEEVAEQVREGVRGEKFRITREERIKDIRGKYTVDIEKSALKSEEADMSALLQALTQQAGAAEHGEAAEENDHQVTASV